MARINIDDLSKQEEISSEELKQVFGGVDLAGRNQLSTGTSMSDRLRRPGRVGPERPGSGRPDLGGVGPRAASSGWCECWNTS